MFVRHGGDSHLMPRYSRLRPLYAESGTTHTRPIHVLESTHSSSLTNSLPYICNHMQACHFPLGWEPVMHFRNCQRVVQQTFPLISPVSTFQVESLATPDYASWSLWTKHEPTWFPMLFRIKCLPSVIRLLILRPSGLDQDLHLWSPFLGFQTPIGT